MKHFLNQLPLSGGQFTWQAYISTTANRAALISMTTYNMTSSSKWTHLVLVGAQKHKVFPYRIDRVQSNTKMFEASYNFVPS